MFLPWFVCLFVCLSVNTIRRTRKVVDLYRQNLKRSKPCNKNQSLKIWKNLDSDWDPIIYCFFSSFFIASPGLLQLTAVRCLQSVQNAAARLVTGSCRRDLIKPLLRQLHWLPVGQRVTFKVLELVEPSTSHYSCSCVSVRCWWLSAAVGCK